ncbi:hypothetical protein BC834DRAFT_240514 [Gloeopeniophorella convolvens]|nr:hypothetical protein BC834DRAFT_240514 [Gloeopeniophorella convolvens]
MAQSVDIASLVISIPLLTSIYAVYSALPCFLLGGVSSALSESSYFLDKCIAITDTNTFQAEIQTLRVRFAELRIASNRAPGYVGQFGLFFRGSSWRLYVLRRDVHNLLRGMQSAFDAHELHTLQSATRNQPESDAVGLPINQV